MPTGLRPELETNPSLPLRSLSEFQPRRVPSELCVRDACSLPVCTRSLGRTGQGEPCTQPWATQGSVPAGRRPCLRGLRLSHKLQAAMPLRSCSLCVLTAGGVHKTSRCISPWRPDSLPSVGALPGASFRDRPPQGPPAPASAAVSCPECPAHLLSKFRQLAGRAGRKEVSEPLEGTAASLLRGRVPSKRDLSFSSWSGLPSAQGASAGVGVGRRRTLSPGWAFASCVAWGRSDPSLSLRRGTCKM